VRRHLQKVHPRYASRFDELLNQLDESRVADLICSQIWWSIAGVKESATIVWLI